MNHYIDSQIKYMESATKFFQKSCEMAATDDDGEINKNEKKALNRIKKAVDTFLKELEKAAKDNSGFLDLDAPIILFK